MKEDNALDLTIDNSGTADWNVQLKQEGVTLKKGKTYKLSFDIKSSVDRSFTYAIQRDGSKHNDDWTPYVQETAKLSAYGEDGQFTHIEKKFTMDYDTDVASVFNIALGIGGGAEGKDTITNQHRVVIDNIKLEIVK